MQLLERQGAGHGADHPRRALDPPARGDLVAHALPLDAMREQLTPGDHPGLTGDQILECLLLLARLLVFHVENLPSSAGGPRASPQVMGRVPLPAAGRGLGHTTRSRTASVADMLHAHTVELGRFSTWKTRSRARRSRHSRI